VRDSFAASESIELAPNGVAAFDRNGWPDCVGMGGRLRSERVAGLRRNQWPDWLGLRTHGERWAIGDSRNAAKGCSDANANARFCTALNSSSLDGVL
jgi:hypothetical protein